MAFFISMPADFKVGETRDCRINFGPARVTWRNNDTLVIEPDDARKIVFVERRGETISFACSDVDDTAPSIISEMDLAPPAGDA
jgi:hypothetical protein